jgi:hypothetical protein
MTTTEENKALFRRTYEELLNGGDLSVADALVAPDFINHEAPVGRDRSLCRVSRRTTAAVTRPLSLLQPYWNLSADGLLEAAHDALSGSHLRLAGALPAPAQRPKALPFDATAPT